MKNFILPFKRDLRNIICGIDEFLKEQNLMINDSKIKGFFGTFNNCIFSGKEAIQWSNDWKKNDIYQFLVSIEKQNLKFFLYFTNEILTKEYLLDPESNLELSLVEKFNGGVILNNPVIKKYVEDKYPKLEIINLKDDLDDSNDNSITYYSNVDKILEGKKIKNIFVNSECPASCFVFKQCRKKFSEEMLSLEQHDCLYIKKKTFKNLYQEFVYNSSKIWLKQNILYDLEKNGVENFFIESFNDQPIIFVMILANYLIQPEFQEKFIFHIIFKYNYKSFYDVPGMYNLLMDKKHKYLEV